jgi:ABC-type lipoprotein export system ATPase subunit
MAHNMAYENQIDTFYLEIANLQKTYKNKNTGEKKTIFNNLNLQVTKGEFIGIIGDNGVGKTTLLQILGLCDLLNDGVDSYQVGETTIFSNSRNGNLTNKEKELSKIRQESFGIVFQYPRLIPFLNCRQNLELPLILRKIPSEERGKSIEKVISKVFSNIDLPTDLLDKTIPELSGGTQQLLSIARALITAPPILLADEAISSLAPDRRSNILKLFKELSIDDGLTIIMTTHFQEEVKHFADRIFSIENLTLKEKTYTPISSLKNENLIINFQYDFSDSFTGDISGANLTALEDYYKTLAIAGISTEQGFHDMQPTHHSDIECELSLHMQDFQDTFYDLSITDTDEIKPITLDNNGADNTKNTMIRDIRKLGCQIFINNFSNMVTLSVMLLGLSFVLTMCFSYEGGVNKKLDSMKNSFKRIMVTNYLVSTRNPDVPEINNVEKIFMGLNHQIFLQNNHGKYDPLQVRSLIDGDHLYEDMNSEQFRDSNGLEVIFTNAGLNSLGFNSRDSKSYIGEIVKARIRRQKTGYSRGEIEEIFIPLKIIGVIPEGIDEGQPYKENIGLYIPDNTLQFFRSWTLADIDQLDYNNDKINNNPDEISERRYNRLHVYPREMTHIETVRNAIHNLGANYSTVTREKDYKAIIDTNKMITNVILVLMIVSLVIPPIISFQTWSFISNKRTEITIMKIMGGDDTYISIVYSVSVLIAALFTPVGILIAFILSILWNSNNNSELFILYNNVALFIMTTLALCFFLPIVASFCTAFFAVKKRNPIEAFQR